MLKYQLYHLLVLDALDLYSSLTFGWSSSNFNPARYFFKGWFNEKTWPILEPDFNEISWRKNLAENICNFFEPQFISNSTKNVIGEPVGETECIGKDKGFTQLGENRNESLDLNIDKFKLKFVEKLSKHRTVNYKECFNIA